MDAEIEKAILYSQKLLDAAIGVVGAARVELNANWARDPKIIALAILCRSISNFRAAIRLGDYKDTAQIASKFDLSEAYVRRILRLAYLAPDVVLAIAEGRHPPTLVLQRLLAPIPLAWAGQRQTLGFTV
jgi:hypothetical protein